MGEHLRGAARVKSPPWLLVSVGEIGRGPLVDLDPAEGRHATGPLRLRSGDEVVLADGMGRMAAAKLVVAGRSAVRGEVISVDFAPPPAGDGITLALAIIDPRAMDWAVQKAVEIGVRRFRPIVTGHTQAGRRGASSRADHWRRIALQALKQCHRPWAMEVTEPQPLNDVIAECEASPGVVADPGGVGIGSLPPSAGRVLAVGPEGGFSPAEDELLSVHGWARLKLGVNILRSETAAVVGAALMVARDEKTGGEGVPHEAGESRHE
jgi:16S rRNA (uracil1498-N3)-methyltransferase